MKTVRNHSELSMRTVYTRATKIHSSNQRNNQVSKQLHMKTDPMAEEARSELLIFKF